MTLTGIHAPKRERQKTRAPFMINYKKISKNNYEVLAGDLNVRVGKILIQNICREQSHNGKRLRDLQVIPFYG